MSLLRVRHLSPISGRKITSNSATLAVTASASSGSTDVLTHHYDVSRSGVNSTETLLTTSNVNSATFGKVGEFAVDGQIDGQALFLSQLAIPGQGNKNVLYVATEKNTVYAVDAQSISGSSATILWQTKVLPNGETPATSLPCGNISPNGITATPVIDRTRNAIYVEAMSQNSAGNIIHRLHALDLTNGNELFGGPTTITATYPGTGGNSSGGVVTFDPPVQHDRAALLESGNTIYTAWSGLWGDCGSYSAWVIAFDAGTLKQTGAIDLVPNNSGGGMWMGGGGPAADASGNVYVISGNGFRDTPGMNSYGNSFVRLTTSAGLKVGDYFTPFNTLSEDAADADFGSAGPLLLPDLVDASNTTRHLAVGAGKDGNLYVLNRDNLGQFNSSKNNIYQQFQLSSGENHSSPSSSTTPCTFVRKTIRSRLSRFPKRCWRLHRPRRVPMFSAAMERLPASPRMAARKESFGLWTGAPGFCSPTMPATLQRSFTTRTKQPQTGTTSPRSEDISSHRWLRTAESTSALRLPSPSSDCCLKFSEVADRGGGCE